jgi:hypothetical protein
MKSFSSNNLQVPIFKTPKKQKRNFESIKGENQKRILKAPFCLLEKPKIGTHFEFKVLEKSHILEINLRVYQHYSLGRISQLRTSFESAKRIGFEDMNVIDKKFETLQKFRKKE